MFYRDWQNYRNNCRMVE